MRRLTALALFTAPALPAAAHPGHGTAEAAHWLAFDHLAMLAAGVAAIWALALLRRRAVRIRKD